MQKMQPFVRGYEPPWLASLTPEARHLGPSLRKPHGTTSNKEMQRILEKDVFASPIPARKRAEKRHA